MMYTIALLFVLLVAMRAVFLVSKINSFSQRATGMDKMAWFWENAYPKWDPIARVIKWGFSGKR